MNKIIAFLSEYGEKGSLISPEELQALAKKYQLTAEELQVILSNNSKEIAELLDSKANVFAILIPAEDDDEEDESDDTEEAENIAA